MLKINTNLSSIIVQKGFNNSTSSLNKTIEAMSTGYKLNHARDNTANYSISTNMTTKLSSYFVAEENVKMGMELIDTASSSIDLISNHLERIRDLAIQAENGVYGEASKKAINEEVNARVDEIERIYASSEYNGVKFGGEHNVSKTIHDVNRRDVSSLESFENVKIDEALTGGTYSIKTADELAKLATMTNNGLIEAGVEFVLGADIDLNTYSNWTPIGNNTNKFKGIFDGNGYVISNLKINSAGNQLGLFGRTSQAEIKNVALESINIILNGGTSSNKHIGGLVGYLDNNSTLSNSYVTGKIDARSQVKMVGGLVGQVYNGCVIDSCYSESDVINVNSMGGNLLGVLENNSVLKNSFATGKSQGGTAIAGLVGIVLTSSTIENSYSTGDVKGNQSAGIVGSIHTNSSIVNSWTSSQVNAISGTTTAGIAYSASGATLDQVYVLDENNKHSGIFVATYRSSGTGNIIIKNSYYSDYYKNYSIPISGTNKTSINNVNSYSGEVPFIYNNQSNIYKLHPNVNLQIGISEGESSMIKVRTSYVLKDLRELRKIGISFGNFIEHCDLLLSDLNDKKVEFGTTSNMLTSVLDEISAKYINLASSRSTLRDADISEVSSEHIKYQILQQASATLLSTANQTPAIALQLI